MSKTESEISGKSAGRTVGVLLLFHLVLGLMAPFIILNRVVAHREFLTMAAGSPNKLRVAVLLLFVGSAIAIGIASTGWAVFRQYSPAMALWLFALAVASFSLQAVDNSRLLSMLSLSQEYIKAGAAKADLFQALAIVVGSARRWSHYSFLLVIGSWILLLCCLLYRFLLVPRVLAAFGVVGSVLQIGGVTLRGLWGYPPETWLAVPLAPAYAGLALWLIVKGFDERHGLGAQRAETTAA
ncbi:MAG TPA: DUF4386 domain-containing protein [Terriglobales bacterium]|nr:DUF4386 domain-containing protein [Terriglobales bacterium]